MKLLSMLFWEVIFVLFILPWAWFPMALDLWDDNTEPKWVRWIMNKAIGI